MKVAVLGAMGLMAEASLHDLARQGWVSSIVAADLRMDRLRAVRARLPSRRKVAFAALDIRDTARAARALAGCRVVVNAAWYEHNLKAMDLALALNAHCVDLGGLYHMTRRQLGRAPEFRRRGLLCVAGCGSTPGITNMMVAGMAPAFGRIRSVGIYDAGHDPDSGGEGFLPPFSVQTMLDEYELPAPILEGGRMVAAPAHSRREELDFPAPIGRVAVGAVIHSETATLPRYLAGLGVRDLAFKIAYPDSVRAWLALLTSMGFSRREPVSVAGARVSPRGFVAALAAEGARALPRRPRDFEVLRVRAAGSGLDGRGLAVEWDCELRPDGCVSAGAVGVGYAASVAAGLVAAGKAKLRAGVCAPESAFAWDDFHRELMARKAFRVVERVERPLEPRPEQRGAAR